MAVTPVQLRFDLVGIRSVCKSQYSYATCEPTSSIEHTVSGNAIQSDLDARASGAAVSGTTDELDASNEVIFRKTRAVRAG
jgi:hypothetical protein